MNKLNKNQLFIVFKITKSFDQALHNFFCLGTHTLFTMQGKPHLNLKSLNLKFHIFTQMLLLFVFLEIKTCIKLNTL